MGDGAVEEAQAQVTNAERQSVALRAVQNQDESAKVALLTTQLAAKGGELDEAREKLHAATVRVESVVPDDG